MTRYFQAFVTSRPVEVDGQAFIFERVEPMGGSWLGVLALDDESSANKLAAAGFEIGAEQYAELKKKATEAQRPASTLSRQPTPPPQPLVGNVAHVVLPGSSGAESVTGNAGEAAPVVKPLASVSLLTTRNKPPAEPLLDAPAERKPRLKAAA